jgi:hypothetical protein
MTNFNWKIEQLEYDLTENNSVITAHWRCTATDETGEFSAGSYGTCGFSADPKASGFVQYADLTEALVLRWCYADRVDRDAIEASLQANIDLQMAPVQASGVPW